MKLLRKVGVTSEIWQVFIRDSSSTTGAGLAGLTNASSGLTAYYHRDTDTTATAISLVSMTVGTFTSSGFKEIDATNMPGWYQFCPPNAALASGAKSCAFHLKGATNMAPLPIECQLISVDVDDSVRAGLTALPNAAAEAAGGLYTRGTGAGQIKQTNNGEIDSNATHINNVATTSVTTINANVGTTQPENFTGTGASALVKVDAVDIAGAAVSTSTAQIGVNVVNFGGSAGTFASGRPEVNTTHFGGSALTQSGGRPEVNWTHIKGTAVTEGGAGRLAGAFSTMFDVAAPVLTTASVNQTGDSFARLTGTGAVTFASLTVSGATTFTGAITATNGSNNITGVGAVASVTGAVGSVTGNVGGNVVGSVASVTGNVGGNVVGSVASVTAPVTLTSAYDFAKGTAAMTESYNADGAAPTPAQALFVCLQMLTEKSITGTTLTMKKLDGSTTAATFTLNDATTPTSITRTT